jgi:hypothetical protein
LDYLFFEKNLKKRVTKIIVFVFERQLFFTLLNFTKMQKNKKEKVAETRKNAEAQKAKKKEVRNTSAKGAAPTKTKGAESPIAAKAKKRG